MKNKYTSPTIEKLELDFNERIASSGEGGGGGGGTGCNCNGGCPRCRNAQGNEVVPTL